MDTQQQQPLTQTQPSAAILAVPARSERSHSPVRTVVIIGAGFSGTAVAMHLLRLPHPQPLRIVLVERRQVARGLAYASHAGRWLLNVPAARMSASSSDPLQFLAYARRSLPHATAADFLPRELYGEYLESTLLSAALAAPPHVRLEKVHQEAIAIEKAHRSSSVHVHLDNGAKMTAHTVVLATGHLSPATLPGSDSVNESRYLGNPWGTPIAFRPGETVVIAGTGLTMADVVLAGQDAAKGQATIHAISRHGLVPALQSDFQQLHDAYHKTALMRGASVSLRHLVRQVRALAADIEARGGDWREAVTALRAVAPDVWQQLTSPERKRFLRHVRSYWDIHRQRLPTSTWSALSELLKNGRLQLHAGRIIGMETVGKRVQVTWRARGRSVDTKVLVDRVVNCTGPQYDVRRTRERLLRSLTAQGIAVPDPLGLGISTEEFGALVDASGRVAPNLYYIGPMLRPRHWETTAVQELRIHAENLACHLALQARSWAIA